LTPDRALLLHGAVDRAAGESFTYQPYAAADPNARAAADGTRAAQVFTGVWVAPSVEANRRPRLDMGAVRQGAMRQVSAGRPCVKLQAAALPYAAALGDRVLRALTGERWEVAAINSDGYGRIYLELTMRGS
jgi:hypothetical protein